MHQKSQLGIYCIPTTSATPPKFATPGSACFDICACLHTETVQAYYGSTVQEGISKTVILHLHHPAYILIPPNHRALIPTGLILDIREGFSVRLHARSGLAVKYGIVLSNGEGIIDHDYTHELIIAVTNNNDVGDFKIEDGMRICQAELVECCATQIVQVHSPPERNTTRVGGFGSTGT